MYDGIAAKQSDELQVLRKHGRDAPMLETLARAIRATLGLSPQQN